MATMNLDSLAQVILAIATLVTALGAFIISLINTLHLKRVATNVQGVAANVQTIEQSTNSMKDQLVETAAKAALAEGKEVGLQQGLETGLHHGLEAGLQVKKDTHE